MSKRVKVCLALFLALAVIAQYSFSPQVMIAYGEEGEVTAASEESSGDDGQTAEKKEAEKPAPAPEQKTTEAPAPAPAASSDSSDTPEPAESAAPAEENDSADADETSAADDVDVGEEVGEEELAVDEEEADEEEYPAQDFSGAANGVSVTVNAPKGALPEGTKMSVSGVSATQVQTAVEGVVGGEVAGLKAVDITFRCDGKEVEPKKAVSVHMTASGVEADTVVHISDGGGANVVGASTSGSSASFKSADFSIYAVVDTVVVEGNEDNNITIHYNTDGNGSVSRANETVNLEATDFYLEGSTAEAAEGFEFVKWIDSEGNIVSTKADYVPSVSLLEEEIEGASSEVTFTAIFAAESEMIELSFNPNAEEGDELAPIRITVAKGETIGDKLPTVPTVTGYDTKWVKEGTATEVTADTVVEEAFNAEVAKKKITYTVTFVQEDGTEVTKTTDVTQGFAINSLPEVAPKTNKVGKWVYPGTTNEFTVGTVVSGDLTVEAYYEQNIFTVDFIVDGSTYETMTTATGTTIVLPSDPIKKGATFMGWFTEEEGQGTQYTAESTVTEDLTLYAYFKDQVRVSFIVRDDQGQVISEKSQYFIDLEAGDQITTLPDDPFVEGKTFSHWKNEDNGDTVEVGYVVEDSFNAVAVFDEIGTYELTVKYFYLNEAGDRIDIGEQVYDLVENDFTYTVTAPGYTIATEVTDEPTYYPSEPTIKVTAEDFTYSEEDGKYICTEEDEYVAADAKYNVGHYLKALEGEEYGLIETVQKEGVKNSKVTPDINNYDYAVYSHRDTDVTITGDENQELKVYYDRRDFTLSYNVGEGTYIDAQTAPYGTEITLPTTAQRTGYEFAGWYKDADCTESAGTKITLEADTTLYAKWNAAQSKYKIVYMIENADDDGYSYLGTANAQAPTNSSVTLTKTQADNAAPSDLDKTNFTFKDSSTETIKADGTTVVIVRYSRNVYTITWEGSGYEDWNSWTQTATWHTGRGHATLTAKYGANISQQWTATFNTPHPNWAWNFSRSNNDEKFTSLDIMPSGNKTVYHWYYTTTKTQVLNYWMENYDSATTTTRQGRTYGLFKSVTVHYNYLYDTDYPDYAGYTKGGWVRSDGARTLTAETPQWTTLTADFYYNAKQYPLTFVNYDGSQISTQQVTLNADISRYLRSNIPAAPVQGAEWKGWFTDAEHQNPYTYTGTPKMPTGLNLYGDFAFPTRTVTFNSHGGTDVASQTDEYGFYATAPSDPEKEGYIFQGWFTAADENGSPYDWNKPVTENITLHAHWTQKTIGYTVHYYKEGTTTTVLPDKIVSDPAFKVDQKVTETAPTVAGLVPDSTSLDLTLTFDDEKNVITFYYAEIPDELTYTVNYVLKDHSEIKVAESKTITVPGTTTNVLEMAVEVDTDYLATQTSDPDILGTHYKPTETSKELQLAIEDNVITFEYVPYTTAKITVNYLDMDGKVIEKQDVNYVEKGDTFTLQNKAPDGFVYHHAYLDGTTTAPESTYQITGDEGNLVINIYYQKKLIIIANNKSKVYDGTALKSEGLGDATVTGTLRGDELTSIAYDGSQTDAGTSATTPKNAQITKGAQAITNPEVYYSIIYVPGSLTIKPVSVYISISADQWNTHSGGTGPNYYTGEEFKVGFTNPNKQHFNDREGSAYVSITSGQRTAFKAKYGDAIWAALYGEDGALISEKDAGTYTVSGDEQKAILSGVKVGEQSMMSDPNYSITLNARDCFLTIDKLPLVISTGSAEKDYDGDPLTKTDDAKITYSYWSANIGGTWTPDQKGPGAVTLGTGDAITFNVTGSQTEVGESDNTFNIDWGTDAKSSNYVVTSTKGKLVVKEALVVTLTVTVNDKTATYNGSTQEGYAFPATVEGTGKPISEDAYTVTGLMEGHKLSVGYTAASGENANADAYEGEFATSYTIVDADGKDVSKIYTTKSFTPGKLTINKRNITISSASDSKVYDGTPLTNGNYSVDGKFVSGQEPVITVTGSQTEVGSSKNTIKYSFDSVAGGMAIRGDVRANAAATGDNYNIKLNEGTLTVTAAPGPTPPTPTPTPTPDGDGGGPAAAAAPAAAPTQVVADEPAPTTIDEPAPPKAVNAYWALINLLCAIATALLSLIMLIRYFGKRKDEEELTDPATGELVTRDVEEQRGGLARIASLVPAIGGIIAFLLTEDMSLPMAMVDKWTVLMIVILAVQAGVGIVAKLRDEKDDEDEEAMA